MNRLYLQSIWKPQDENKGYHVRNFHRDDRRNEDGIDLLCNKNNLHIGFAFKKKPKKEDIAQLQKLHNTDAARVKYYVFLDEPTTHFVKEMEKYSDILFLNSSQYHSLLFQNGSINYVLLYFSAHQLFDNLSAIYHTIYKAKDVRYYRHHLTPEELVFLWNVKDDAVKLKASLEFLQSCWRPILMTRLDYNKSEWIGFIEKIHKELDIVNNLAGESLNRSFGAMLEKYPHLAAYYWMVICQRTTWKDFAYTATELGKQSSKALHEFIRYQWVVPILEYNRRSTEYGPIGSIYSALWAVIESMYNISNDLENGIDWIYSDLV